MLKGLKKLLFNTDIDDISEEGELEEIQLPQHKEDRPQKEAFAEAQAPAAEEKKPFVGINADVVEKEKKASSHSGIQERRNIAREKEKESRGEINVEFEFKPVISPIYGNTAEKDKKPEEVHDAIHLSKANAKNTFNTVLSPMYGAYQPQPDEKKKNAEQDAALRLHDSFWQNEELSEESEEEPVLTLEEMLVQGEAENETETVQISLFGESTPLQADVEDEAHVYTVEE